MVNNVLRNGGNFVMAKTQAQYSLTPEQEAIREMVRELAQRYVAPGAAERDRSKQYPWDMLQLLVEHDLLAVPFPEKYGGSGEGMLTGCVVVETLTQACYNTSYLLVI